MEMYNISSSVNKFAHYFVFLNLNVPLRKQFSRQSRSKKQL